MTNWPAKAVKIDKRNVEVVTAVLRVEADGHGAAYLQVQRPQGGVLAGKLLLISLFTSIWTLFMCL